MILSQYYIYVNDKKLAISDNIDLFHLKTYGNDEFELILLQSREITIFNDFKIRQEDLVTISYYINNTCICEFFGNIIEKEYTLTNCQKFSLLIKTSDEPPITIMTILKEWAQGNDFLYWKNNKCKESKKLWLTACLYWQQIFLPKSEKTIHVSLYLDGVSNYLDFFCMLGEAFFGKRGYIGKDFHGFDGLLSDLSYKKSEINIYTNNIKKLKLLLERISPPEHNYYDIFIDILINRNCNLIEK
ncbi:hypothetical protein [Xenorhabdus sp. KJ12.1]|uniref:hypothetical protein n=1 Tax=Xenorhabdus sp. KJ12.1 TaxID=1851571 RepID=UPI000C03FEF9|nr:hypothetical protein [Xenorhabdus sp. KJ12.1]PHM70782.1 hypothetical protein Xekj_01590 [Xenorhabdus sp. KJ12.1]